MAGLRRPAPRTPCGGLALLLERAWGKTTHTHTHTHAHTQCVHSPRPCQTVDTISVAKSRIRLCEWNKHVSSREIPHTRARPTGWRAAVEAFQHCLFVCGMDLSAWIVWARVMEPAVYILRCSLHRSTRVSSPAPPPPSRSLPPLTWPSFADKGAPARVCTRRTQTSLKKHINATTRERRRNHTGRVCTRASTERERQSTTKECREWVSQSARGVYVYSIHTHTHTHIYIYICIYIHICIYMCVCVCVCVCVYIYIYIYM